MIENDCKMLIDYIEEMISDGVQLAYGEHLLGWNDTKIPKQIAKIKAKGKELVSPKLNPGNKLRHKVSGQNMWVINDDGKTIFLNPGTPTIKFPLDKVLKDFILVEKIKNK